MFPHLAQEKERLQSNCQSTQCVELTGWYGFGKNNRTTPLQVKGKISCQAWCCHMQCYRFGVHRKSLNKRLIHALAIPCRLGHGMLSVSASISSLSKKILSLQ